MKGSSSAGWAPRTTVASRRRSSKTATAQVNSWLDEGEVVYLHCRAGWQRSAAVAAGAIAIREGIEPEQRPSSGPGSSRPPPTRYRTSARTSPAGSRRAAPDPRTGRQAAVSCRRQRADRCRRSARSAARRCAEAAAQQGPRTAHAADRARRWPRRPSSSSGESATSRADSVICSTSASSAPWRPRRGRRIAARAGSTRAS